MQARSCPACSGGGAGGWTIDAFGAFRVIVDSSKARRVARDGGKFLYDDATDSLVRLLWPARVAEYAQVDVDRERALPLLLGVGVDVSKMVQADGLACM